MAARAAYSLLSSLAWHVASEQALELSHLLPSSLMVICRSSDRTVACVVMTGAHSFAGASFFYQPDTLPYEAQEVRAFGLLLADMAVRITAAGSSNSGNGDASHTGTAKSSVAADDTTSAGLGAWLRSWASGRARPAEDTQARSAAGTAARVQPGRVSSSSGCSGSGIASQLADLAAQCTAQAVGSRPSFVDVCQQLQRLSTAILSST